MPMSRPSGSRALLPRAHGGEPDLLGGDVEALGKVAAVVMLLRHVVVRHRRRGHEILAPHLHGLAPDRARDGIHGELDREAHAGAGHAAIGREGRLVGRDRVGLAAIAVEVVGPRQVAAGLGRLEAGREGPHRIGADVDGDLGVERQEPAAPVGIGGHVVMMLARVGRRRQGARAGPRSSAPDGGA